MVCTCFFFGLVSYNGNSYTDGVYDPMCGGLATAVAASVFALLHFFTSKTPSNPVSETCRFLSFSFESFITPTLIYRSRL
jgi:hypothetical protein